jgi:hypothetical protein
VVGTQPIFYACRQPIPKLIRHVVWLNLRFILGYRDVGEPMTERGLGVSCEATS